MSKYLCPAVGPMDCASTTTTTRKIIRLNGKEMSLVWVAGPHLRNIDGTYQWRTQRGEGQGIAEFSKLLVKIDENNMKIMYSGGHIPIRVAFDTCLLYDFKRGKTATESQRDLCDAFAQDVISKRQCQRWFYKSRFGNESLEDDARGRPPSVVDMEQLMEAIEEGLSPGSLRRRSVPQGIWRTCLGAVTQQLRGAYILLGSRAGAVNGNTDISSAPT
ncbi:hypothetical protein ANCDUO_02665 [Ancylostoma duodenale]|uniref:Mos1 transposase HTH domain-containing protein n=1 Tax=Ancylostoma duodenale TaxID=51022 RepID=A0A0C2H644_9BILA|nr:hypothetical protein ANCDUO_02665 [Ancylostoma duodenale]